jgi:hypothetical protein
MFNHGLWRRLIRKSCSAKVAEPQTAMPYGGCNPAKHRRHARGTGSAFSAGMAQLGSVSINLESMEVLGNVIAGLLIAGLAAVLIAGYIAGRSRLKRAERALRRRRPRRSLWRG